MTTYRDSLLTGISLLAVCFALPGVGLAQFVDDAPEGTGGSSYSEETTKQTMEIGIIVQAAGGPVKGLIGTIPVPMDWPEQRVVIVKEDISSTVRKVKYRMLNGTVKQMEIEIPSLPPGAQAKAVITFEITRRVINVPQETSQFRIPEKLDSRLRKYLAPSPMIETRHQKIRSLAEEATAGAESDWAKVEAIYDTMRDKVELTSRKLQGAVATLEAGTGDVEDMTNVFIAMCRASKIPARTVWVRGHCYPEFYLTDADGKGYWFPCEASGDRSFGGIADQRVIFQKGDNFRVPGQKKPVRYVPEHLKGKGRGNQGTPKIQFVRKLLQN